MDWLLEEVELWLVLLRNDLVWVSEEGLEWILELDLLWVLWLLHWDLHTVGVDGSLWLWVEERTEEVEVLVLLLMAENLAEHVVVLLWLNLSFDGSLLVVMVRWVEHSGGGLLDLLEELLDSLEEVSKVWEHKSKLVHVGHLAEVLLKLLMELLVEDASLDVLLLDRLIPLEINTPEISDRLSVVGRGSVNFSHDLLISVAGVILHEKLVEVESNSHELEHVVEESVLETFHVFALTWVLKAEVLPVVSDLLELANVIKLVDVINDSSSSVLPLIDINFPEFVLMEFMLKSVEDSPGLIHPVTEAFIRDDIMVLLVETLEGSSVESFHQFSVSLSVVESWFIALSAEISLLQHTEEWLVHVLLHPFAGGGGSENGGVLVHFFKI